jgi:hypothetical protein
MDLPAERANRSSPEPEKREKPQSDVGNSRLSTYFPVRYFEATLNREDEA